MLRVLRHYLPLRKALLILSEAVLLTAVLSAWMTAHLWQPSELVLEQLYEHIPALKPDDALLRCVYSCFLLSVLAQLAIGFNELYDVRISGSRVDRSGRFVESAGSALALSLLAVFVLPTWGLPQALDFPPLSTSQRIQTLVFAMLSGFAVLYGWRTIFHWALRRTNFGERVLILGGGKRARELAREIRERPDMGYELVGLVPESGPERGPAGVRRATRNDEGKPAIPLRPRLVGSTALAGVGGPAGDAEPGFLIERPAPLASREDANDAPLDAGEPAPSLAALVQRERVDLVVVALEDRRKALPIDDLLQCRLDGVSVIEQESVYERITGKIAVDALRPSYLIFNEGFSRHPWAALSKRAFDLTIGFILIALTWPLMLLTALAVRFDSAGPILFTQERVGRDGRPFVLLKFRSMRADAERATGPVWATQDDPRITRVGRFIRKTRLDELPQLVNVLAGHMSIVGPRPEREHFVAELAQKIPYFRQRHIVKPGLTGWAQINYRYGASFEDSVQKLQYDLYYIKNQSLLFDLSILFNTVKIVILRKGT
jgi:lipopolysaccharide/colanic/teichoic acid biosynthesis glycosyltransferase